MTTTLSIYVRVKNTSMNWQKINNKTISPIVQKWRHVYCNIVWPSPSPLSRIVVRNYSCIMLPLNPWLPVHDVIYGRTPNSKREIFKNFLEIWNVVSCFFPLFCRIFSWSTRKPQKKLYFLAKREEDKERNKTEI